MPDDLRLPEEEDATSKKLRKAEQELADLKNKLPKLKLQGFEGRSFGMLFFRPPIDSRTRLNGLLGRLRLAYPPMKKTQMTGNILINGLLVPASYLSQPINGISDGDIDKYNAEIETFLTEYENWYLAFEAALNFRRLTCPLFLTLKNDGSAPAEDVELKLHLPDGFDVLDQEIDLPSRPSLPKKPQTLMEKMASTRLGAWIPSLDHKSLQLPQMGSRKGLVSLRKSNSYDALFHWPRIRHFDEEVTGEIYVNFHDIDQVKSFTLDYQILAANSPRPETGKLDIRCEIAGCPNSRF
jgi:hypothetical protein